MQKVSKAYKESMKSSLRERAYIMVSFGLINQEAQSKAKIEDGDFSFYSNADNIFGETTNNAVYATLEENFTKVDGSMLFLPRSGSYINTGLISEKLLTQAVFELTINLNIEATDFKGITIDFGENYPVDFDIISDSETKINRHSPYLSITLHKCYPYYLFGISTFPNLAYHSIALRKFSITIV